MYEFHSREHVSELQKLQHRNNSCIMRTPAIKDTTNVTSLLGTPERARALGGTIPPCPGERRTVIISDDRVKVGDLRIHLSTQQQQYPYRKEKKPVPASSAVPTITITQPSYSPLIGQQHGISRCHPPTPNFPRYSTCSS